MIHANTCIVCGRRRLEREAGGIAPFIAHRCGIEPAGAVMERCWCPGCDLLFFQPRLDEAEVRRLYVGYRDPAYVLERTRFEPGYEARHPDLVEPGHPVQQARIRDLAADFASLSRPLGRVLDFGGGDGWLTRNAFPGGDVVVYDLQDGVAEPPAGTFDLVVCAHVLEHVSFPVPFLRDLKRYVGPGGLLYVEVPGPGRRAPGSRVFDYAGAAMHEHVSFFSGRAVLKLLHRCGLKPVWTVATGTVTKAFARPACLPRLAEWLRPGTLPPPVRGPRGSDTLPGLPDA